MNLKNLYDCNLCNHCHLAGLNRSTREKSVRKGIINQHVAKIRENIAEHGNSYGIETVKRERIKEIQTRENSNMKTILFRGCTPTYKTPEILKSAENLLKSKDIEYEVMDDETCCGNILFNLGEVNAGSGVVQRNIDKFKARGAKRIITLCPGCYSAFNSYYKTDTFNPEIILLVELMEDLTCEGDFAVQDPCHTKEKGVKVRKILSGATNKSPSPCCGAGGGVMMHNKTMATSKALKTLENNGKVVTYCPFCYLNLSSVSENQVEDIYMLLAKNTCISPESAPY